MQAPELLSQARALLGLASPATRGLWPRAAALLARQALEGALDDYWQARRLPIGREVSRRAQFICLREYARAHEKELAARLHHAWTALSQACHHHGYELAPTAGELQGWMEVVGDWLARQAGPSSP